MTKPESIPVGYVPPACCPISRHALLPGGVPGPSGDVPGPSGGVPGSGGCTWSRGGAPGPRGCTWLGVPGMGVYLVPGGVPTQVPPRPPWTESQTTVKI